MDLPDLKAKVKVDTSGITETQAKLAAFGALVKHSLSDTNGPIRDLQAGLQGVDLTLSDTSRQMAATGTSATQAGGGLLSMGSAGAVLIGVVVALGVALAPVVVILGGFTVGLAAALTVMTLGIAGFAALGGGAVLLAARTGLLAAPLATLKDNVTKAADALGKQAAPAAAQVLALVNSLITPIQTMVSHTLDWLNANGRLGPALQLVGRFADIFLASLSRLGQVIGAFLDSFLSRGPAWQSLFAGTMTVAIAAVQGLLSNLLRLSDWFIARLPTLGPIVAGIFGGIGQMIQQTGNVMGFLVDHSAQLAAAMGQLAPVADAVRGAIGAVSKVFQDHRAQIQAVVAALGAQLGPALQNILQHSDALKVVLIALGVVLIAAAAAIAVVFVAAVVLVSTLISVYGWVANVVGQVARIPGVAGGAIGAFGGLSGAARAVAGTIASIGSVIEGVIAAFGRLASAIRNLPSPSISLPGGLHLQSGGPALPGRVYTVGEAGPETLVMGRGGGYVIPHGGGGPITATLANDRSGQIVALLRQQNELLAAMLSQSPAPAAAGWPFTGR